MRTSVCLLLFFLLVGVGMVRPWIGGLGCLYQIKTKHLLPFLSLSSHVECCSSSSREQLPHAVSIVQFLSKHFVEWLILSSLKILKYIQIHKHSYFKTCEKRKKILLNVRKKYVQDYLNDTKSFTIHANYLKMFLVSRFSSPCWAAGGSCLP